MHPMLDNTERLMKATYEEHLRNAREHRMLKAVRRKKSVSGWLHNSFDRRTAKPKASSYSSPSPRWLS